MTKIKQFSVWDMPPTIKQNKSTNDDKDEDERRQDRSKRYRTAFQNLKCCCCPCSSSVLIGFIIGALMVGIALATILSIYLVDAGKQTHSSTNVILTTTVTLTIGTTATSTSSTVSTTSTSTSSTATSTSSTVATSLTSTSSTATSTSSSSSSSSTSSTSSSTTTSVSTTTLTTTTTTTVSTATTGTTTTTTSTTTTAPYCTTRVTFDDIPGQLATSGVVPNGYNNLNWTNTQYLNASSMPPSGYQMAVFSPPFVAYNPGGATVMITTANGTRFAFNSIILSAAWRDNLIWSLYGYRSGVNLIAAGFSIFVTNQTIISCGGCSDWDTIYMTTSGGTPHSGLAQNGTEFGFDDLCISFGY